MTTRRSARVVLIDRRGHALLFCVDDPQTDAPIEWITPGGGVEPGEELSQAACQELLEETGLIATPDDLGPPVAWTEGDWEWRGAPVHSVDTYFILEVDAFEPQLGAHDEIEKEVRSGHRWWSCEELDSPSESVVPGGLASVVRDFRANGRPAEPVHLPWS